MTKAEEAVQMTVGEAARRLELSTARVRTLCDEGRLDVTRTPLGRLISADSVEAMVEARRG